MVRTLMIMLALMVQVPNGVLAQPRGSSEWRLLITYRDGGAYAINCLSEADAEDKVPRLRAMPDHKLIASIVPQERHMTAWSSVNVRAPRNQ